MVPRAGVEPTTLSLGRICSIQLSYRGIEPSVAYHQLDRAAIITTASLGQLSYRGMRYGAKAPHQKGAGLILTDTTALL